MDGERREGMEVDGGDRDWARYREGEREICIGRYIVYVAERDKMDRGADGERMETEGDSDII